MTQHIIEQNADFISNATFDQSGSDLVITGSDGQMSIVDGYFAQNDTPDIMTPDGARLSPDMVDAFLSPLHAGEYASNNSSMNDASAVGQITDIMGDATVTRADGTKISLESGMPIFEGDIIETGADGAVNILFADQTSFAVSEGARLSVDEFVYDAADQSGSTFFSMLKGAFVYTSGLIGKEDPSSVNIETPAGSIGIRGTVVIGKIDPTGQNSEITIIDGAVVVTNAGGTVELNDNFETVRLTSYEAPPVYAAQMTPEQIQTHYQSLSDVTGKNYGDMGQQQDSQEQSATQQGEESAAVKDDSGSDTSATKASDNANDKTAEEASAAPNADQPTEDAVVKADAEQTAETTTEQTAEAQAEAQTVQPPLSPIENDTSTDTFGDSANDTIITAPVNDTDTGTDTTPPPIVTNDSAPIAADFQFTAFTEIFSFASGVREFLEPGTVVGHVNTNQTGVTFALQAGTGDGNLHIAGTTDNAGGFGSIFNVLPNGDIVVTDTFGVSNFANAGGINIGIDATSSSGELIQTNVNINIEDMAVGGQTVIGTLTLDAALMDGSAGNDTVFGASGDDTLISSSGGNDVLIGGLGNDTLLHAGPTGSNTMIGGDGNDDMSSINAAHTDTMSGGDGTDTMLVDLNSYLSFANIDGGNNFDKLLLGGGTSGTFDLTNAGNFSKIQHIEEIFLNGTGANPGWTVQLTAAAVISMTDENNTLEIQGNGGGATFSTAGTDLIRDFGADVAGFDAYTSGGATLLIENNGDVVVA